MVGIDDGAFETSQECKSSHGWRNMREHVLKTNIYSVDTLWFWHQSVNFLKIYSRASNDVSLDGSLKTLVKAFPMRLYGDSSLRETFWFKFQTDLANNFSLLLSF